MQQRTILWNNVYPPFGIKEQLKMATQNSCEVNREPAHISVASSAWDFDQTELSCNNIHIHLRVKDL